MQEFLRVLTLTLITTEEGDAFSGRGTVGVGGCVSFEHVDVCVRCFNKYNGGVLGTHEHRLVNGDNAGTFIVNNGVMLDRYAGSTVSGTFNGHVVDAVGIV